MKPPSGHYDWHHIERDDVPDLKLRCKHCKTVVEVEKANEHIRDCVTT